MSFIFEEDTQRYGVHLREISEIRSQQTAYATTHVIECTVKFTANTKECLANAEKAPMHSLAKAILSFVAGVHSELSVHDVSGRIWTIQSTSIGRIANLPGYADGSITMTTPTKEAPIKFGNLRVRTPQKKKTNLVRPKGEWKCS